VQWRLGGCRVGQKSLVEFQHAQKSAEEVGSAGDGSLFFRRMGTLGGHLVTERKVASNAWKTHFAGLMRIPYL
jgi:hypothetical protein